LSQVYSTRFYAAQGLSGTGPSVVVPTGLVYVVKQLTIYVDPTTLPTRVYFQDDDSGAALFTGAQTAGNPEWFGFYGALVFESGQGFHWQVDAGPGDGADVYCGGYVLTLP
jgi:hypothetical protein